MTALNENASNPVGWKAGAKALAQFQKAHQGVAKGGEVDGGPRRGNKYATLLDVLKVAAKGTDHGLSHSGQARLVGNDLLVYRCYLTHTESGESIYTEHPIPVPDKGLPGQVQQDLGGCITYARKYCLQELYGLYADDGLDPDVVSYADAEQPAPAPAKQAAPKPVAVKKPKQEKLTAEQHQQAIDILTSNADVKAQFKAKFCPDADAIYPEDIEFKEHLDFLTSLRGAAI